MTLRYMKRRRKRIEKRMAVVNTIAKELQDVLLKLWMLKNGDGPESEEFRAKMANHKIRDRKAEAIITKILDAGRDSLVKLDFNSAGAAITVIVREMLAAGYEREKIPEFLQRFIPSEHKPNTFVKWS